MGLTDVIAAELDDVRRRSLALTDLGDDQLCAQHSPLMSPLVWDLAHVGNYEDQWLLRAVDAHCTGRPDLDGMYDAFRHPRSGRAELQLLPPDGARAYIGEVRAQVLDVLERARPENDDRPLLRDGFVYGMVIQHEHQHDETMLATLQLAGLPAFCPDPRRPSRRGSGQNQPAEVGLPGGEFVMGTDLEPWAYDNERPAHTVTVAPFSIDRAAVTNGQYVEFIDDGGYGDPRWWTDAGWSWRTEAGLTQPEFWRREGDGWTLERFGRVVRVAGDEPVQHVCWYEADAYARWRGRRLPTEAEWEFAAAGADTDGANLGQRYDGPLPAGACDGGTSRWGVEQVLGDVWEWTASDFAPYPGFTSFPYREYSEVFYGDKYKVLRGGSWATHPLAVRTTFRNWDYPIRRQIFAGFRTASDA